jgi:hypothetical protein
MTPNARHHARRRALFIAEGRCADCGRAIVASAWMAALLAGVKMYCVTCRGRKSRADRVRHARNVRAGMCSRCRKRPALRRSIFCDLCSEHLAGKQAARQNTEDWKYMRRLKQRTRRQTQRIIENRI